MKIKKLQLKRETIRELSEQQLAEVNGAGPFSWGGTCSCDVTCAEWTCFADETCNTKTVHRHIPVVVAPG